MSEHARFRNLVSSLTSRAEIDRGKVGVSFIDVLFALVVGQVLEPLVAWDRLPPAAFSHMAVAFFLTVLSWIGYHNSFNRPHYYIGFFNLPLWQFVVDALLVIVYWLTAAYIEGSHQFGAENFTRNPSVRPEVVLVTGSFLLYSVWDLIGKNMRFSARYKFLKEDLDKPRRRTVTYACTGISLFIAIATWCPDPTSTKGVVAVDLILVALLVGYRIAKETVGGRPRVNPEETLEDDFQAVLDKMDRIQNLMRERGDFPR